MEGLTGWNTAARPTYTISQRQRYEALTVLESLRDGGWSWTAAVEKTSREIGESFASIERELGPLARWPKPPGIQARYVAQQREIVSWIIDAGISYDRWYEIQDRYGCTRLTCREAIKLAREGKFSPKSKMAIVDRLEYGPLTVQWLRKPVRRPAYDLADALNDLYRERGPTYYAGRP